MRLLEHESKELFHQFGIPVLERVLITREDDPEEILDSFSFPAIIKSQIAIGSRKKAGLIKIAKNNKEGVNLCKNFLNKNIGNYSIEAVLVEKLADIIQECYCSIILDASERRFSLLASAEGGIDIEEVAMSNPRAIFRTNFTLTEGLSKEQARDIALNLGLENERIEELTALFLKLWEICTNIEALMVEINPLALTPSGFIALDGKIIVDDNAIYRHLFLQKLQEKKYSSIIEKFAKENNLFFVKLEGDVGIMGNGAGLNLALIDILHDKGIIPANFLDIGGGASSQRVYNALRLILDLNPRAILINIFGGITRCDFIAEGILQAIKSFENIPPLIIRLMGNKQREGIELLKKEGINAYEDLMEAISKIKEFIH
ncbi:MAG: succinate--CoA ligase subunit beta [Promethearchaeota archaeon]